MKYASATGVVAALLLIICCFIPWAYYPSLHQNFNGFYSEQNQYGKPGKTFLVLSVLSILFFLVPKIWAKRANQIVAVLVFAYALKNYFLFAACYMGFCPEIRMGLIGMIIFSLTILVCSLLSKSNSMPKS